MRDVCSEIDHATSDGMAGQSDMTPGDGLSDAVETGKSLSDVPEMKNSSTVQDNLVKHETALSKGDDNALQRTVCKDGSLKEEKNEDVLRISSQGRSGAHSIEVHNSYTSEAGPSSINNMHQSSDEGTANTGLLGNKMLPVAAGEISESADTPLFAQNNHLQSMTKEEVTKQEDKHLDINEPTGSKSNDNKTEEDMGDSGRIFSSGGEPRKLSIDEDTEGPHNNGSGIGVFMDKEGVKKGTSYPAASTIVVNGIPQETSKLHVLLLFESSSVSGGAEVKRIDYDQLRGTALIEFETPEGM